MRFARRSSLILILLAGVLAGCGGNRISADEVRVEPPVLTIPTDEDAAPGAAASADTGTDTDDEADASATPEPGTGGAAPSGAAPSGAAPSGAGTGGAAPQPTATATPAPSDNTGGAQADEGLDQFCADNPGAC